MVYGKTFLPNAYKSKEYESVNLESISIAFNEYNNRLSLLESCTNDSERQILEAQVQVLYEVSIKDIVEKIKEAWFKIKRKFFEVVNFIIEKAKPLLEKIQWKENGKMNDLYKELSNAVGYHQFVSLKVAKQMNEFFEKACNEQLKIYTIKLESVTNNNNMTSEKVLLNLSSNKDNSTEIIKKFQNTLDDLFEPLDARVHHLGTVLTEENINKITENKEEQEKAEKFAEELDFFKSLKYTLTAENYEYKYRHVFRDVKKDLVTAVSPTLGGYIKVDDVLKIYHTIREEVFGEQRPSTINLPGMEKLEKMKANSIQAALERYDDYIHTFTKQIIDMTKNIEIGLETISNLSNPEEKEKYAQANTTALSVNVDTNETRSKRVKTLHTAVNMTKDMLDYARTFYIHLQHNGEVILRFLNDRIIMGNNFYIGFRDLLIKNAYASMRPATDDEIKKDEENKKKNGG